MRGSSFNLSWFDLGDPNKTHVDPQFVEFCSCCRRDFRRPAQLPPPSIAIVAPAATSTITSGSSSSQRHAPWPLAAAISRRLTGRARIGHAGRRANDRPHIEP